MSQKPLCTTIRSKWKRRTVYGLYAIFLAIISVAPLAYFLYSDDAKEPSYTRIDFVSPVPKEMIVGSKLHVESCKVLDGHIFHVLLENGEWHEVRLTAVTKEQAIADVVGILKKSGSPTVTLRRQLNPAWVVDFQLHVEGRQINLVEWLRERGLLL